MKLDTASCGKDFVSLDPSSNKGIDVKLIKSKINIIYKDKDFENLLENLRELSYCIRMLNKSQKDEIESKDKLLRMFKQFEKIYKFYLISNDADNTNNELKHLNDIETFIENM